MLDPIKILESAGIKTQSLDKIRLARGVVGKSSTVIAIAVIALGTIALRVTNELILVGFGTAILIVVLYYFYGIRKFAEKNPALALLEGAELVAWKQIELAAMGLPNPPTAPSVENPAINVSQVT